MKLCYEKLDQMKLSRNGYFIYRHKKGCSYIYKEACKYCGEPYLTSTQYTSNFCSTGCKRKYKPSEIELKEIALESKNKTIKSKRYFELRDKGQIHPLYERYKILAPYYEIRRSPEDRDYLEVKCAYCNEWFIPKLNVVIQIKSFVIGHESKKVHSTFYCCVEHQVLLYKERRRIKTAWIKKHIPIEQLILEEKEALTKKELYLKQLEKREEIEFRKEVSRLKRVKRKKEKERKKLALKASRKMSTDPIKLAEYISTNQKERLEKLRMEDPKEFKLRRLFAYSKVRAKEKGMNHSITRKWLDEKTKSNICSATGITFDYDTTIQRNPFGPSIDRIDVAEGYTPCNCRMVIWAFNAGLGHYTEKELYIICKAYLINNM